MARAGSSYRTKRLDKANTAIKAATATFSRTPSASTGIGTGGLTPVLLDGASPSTGSAALTAGTTALLAGTQGPAATPGAVTWHVTVAAGEATLTVTGPDGSGDTVQFWVF